jgi:F0F1-type ATP synthase assembly protein I
VVRVGLVNSRPLRAVLRWQLYITGALTIIAGLWAGLAGAISALLGGAISFSASFVFALIVSRIGVTSAGNVLRTAMRAETSKIALMVILLWLVLTAYKNIVMAAFFATFITTVLASQFALLVRDE